MMYFQQNYQYMTHAEIAQNGNCEQLKSFQKRKILVARNGCYIVPMNCQL